MSSRAKGAAFEREIVNALRDYLGVDCRRNLEQTRSGGEDIILKPYSIECKRRANMALYEWWDQAVTSAKRSNLRPVMVLRADRKDALVVMDFQVFCRLVREEIEPT
jgi:Holliday junction resolvase